MNTLMNMSERYDFTEKLLNCQIVFHQILIVSLDKTLIRHLVLCKAL